VPASGGATGVTSTDPRTLARQASAALGRNDAATAISCLLRAAALAPDMAALHANLAVAFAARGNSADADRSYALAIILSPDLVVARTGLARALAAQGRLAEAAGHLHHLFRIGAAPAGLIDAVRAFLRAADAQGAEDERARMQRGFDHLIRRFARFMMNRGRTKPLLRLACTIERTPDLRQLAAALWTAPVDHYWTRGNWRMVTRLYQRHAAFSRSCRIIYAGYEPRAERRLDPAAEHELQRRLTEARAWWQQAPDRPELRQLLSGAGDRPLSSFGAMGIVVCANLASPRGRAAISGPAIASSAQRLGMPSELLNLDAADQIGIEPFRALLTETIERSRARIVIVETNSITDADAFNAAWAKAIREAGRVKVCIVMPDAHSNAVHGQKFLYWRDAVDRIIYFEPTLRFGADLADKVFLSANLCDEARMHDARLARDIPASFLGAFKHARAYWLAALANSFPGFLMGRDVRGEYLSPDGYVDVLQRSLMALNFGSRESGVSIVTARAWEAIHCGALLLEEHGSALDRFLVPYVHYIPFSSANDLIDKCRFFKKHPERAAVLSREAGDFVRRWYSSERFWTRLVNSLFA